MAFADAHHWYQWLPMWNTLILLTSSFTCHVAHTGILKGNRKQFNVWLGITVALGIIFLALQVAEYYEAYAHFGLTLNSGIYGSTFFMLTGFHGFHVAMGMTMLLIQFIRSVKGKHFTAAEHFGFEASSWYWHFVDVVWVSCSCLFTFCKPADVHKKGRFAPFFMPVTNISLSAGTTVTELTRQHATMCQGVHCVWLLGSCWSAKAAPRVGDARRVTL